VTDEPIGGATGPWTSFKRFFLRGLGALLPTLLTIAILMWAYNFVERNIGRHITRGLITILAARPAEAEFDLSRLRGDLLKYGTAIDEFEPGLGQLTREYRIVADPAAPPRLKRQMLWQVAFAKYHLGLMGFAIAIIVIYFIGFSVTSFLGRTTLRAMESGLGRIPLIKAIYPHVKQVTDFVLSERRVSHSRVVAVQYPRKGIWSVGLLTGPGLRAIRDRAGTDVVSVFIPSSPTPVTGYVITVPVEDVVELSVSMDEAIRFVVTGGLIRPKDPLLPDEASGCGAACGEAGAGDSAARLPGGAVG
jgi:uncharacterized membrane protein